MARLSREDVLKLAKLAKLELTEEEIEQFTGEISGILEYVEQLQQADVDGLEPTSQVTGLKDVTRKDEVKSYGYEPAKLMENVPDKQDGLIKVRRVL